MSYIQNLLLKGTSSLTPDKLFPDDKALQTFWSSHFGISEDSLLIPWSIFKEALQTHFNSDFKANEKGLKALLCNHFNYLPKMLIFIQCKVT